MMVKPPVTDLLKKIESRYELVIATSKRARQLAEGAQPLTKKKEDSVVTLAAVEIDEGKVFIEEKESNENEANNENDENKEE